MLPAATTLDDVVRTSAVITVSAKNKRKSQYFVVNNSPPKVQKARRISIELHYLLQNAQISISLENTTRYGGEKSSLPVVSFDVNRLDTPCYSIKSPIIQPGIQREVYFYLSTIPQEASKKKNDVYRLTITLEYGGMSETLHQFLFTPIKSHNFESSTGKIQNEINAECITKFFNENTHPNHK